MNHKTASKLKNSGHFPPLSTIPDLNEFNIEDCCKEIQKYIDVKEDRKKMVLRLYTEQTFQVTKQIFKDIKYPYKDVIPQYCAYKEQLRQFAEGTPFFAMLPIITTTILERVGKPTFIKKYQSVVFNLMVEVNEEYYIKPLHNLTVDSKVYSLETDDKINHSKILIPPFKFLGRTEHYKKYLRNIAYMNQRLFITYPFIRKIKLHIVDGLPNLAFHFSNLRVLEGMELLDLKGIFERRLMRANLRVEGVWYMQLVKFVSDDTTPIKSNYVHYYFNAAEGLISLYVSMMLRRTMKEFVKFVTDPEETPYLKIQLYCENVFKLSPSPAQIQTYYFSILKEVSELNSYMRALEYFCSNEIDLKYIKLDIPDFFMEECRNGISEEYDGLYHDVYDYMTQLECDFFPIYDETAQTQHINDPNMSFDQGCELIEFYREYIDKLSEIVPNIYFNVCVVNTLDAVDQLRKNGEKIIIALKDKLIQLHISENVDICEMFEFLKMKAETVPQATDELVEMAKYMIWASTEHLNALTERVQNSLNMMLRLIQNAQVDDSYMDLMSRTVNWCFDIKPILDYNASMLERVKFDFEEHLQKTIEKLNKGIQDMFPLLFTFNEMDDADRATEYLPLIRSMIKKIREFDEILLWVNREEGLFKFPLTSFNELNELKRIIFPFFRLLYICHLWRRNTGVWMDGPFEYLDSEHVDNLVENLYKELMKTQKTYRNSLRQSIGEGGLKYFTGLVDDPDPLNQPAPLKLATKALQNVKEFRPVMFIITIFSNKALCQRHWDEMSQLIGFDMTPNAGTTLRKLINQGFGEFLELFEIISTGATKERQLELALAKMKAEWETIRFKIGTYKETGINILIQLDDITAILDDHIVKTLTMRGSVFVKHIEAEVKEWYEKLLRINRTVDEWGKVQGQWLYLLPIFSSKDIVAQMPEEGILFKEVDNIYRRYMLNVVKDSRVVETAGALGVYEAMQECTKMLDDISDGVARYLEKKRLVFTRFFFLSNDEMLEILSETKDPLRVQPHLHKCFEGISYLHFDEDLVIHAMFSHEHEKIDFVTTVNTEEARGGVEKWLVQVEEQMIASIQNELKASYLDYQKTARNEWVTKWPGQIVLAIGQVYWAISVHACLCEAPTSDLVTFHKSLEKQLQNIVALVRQPTLSSLARITVKALIVIDVHAKDVIQDLISKKVKEETDFKWLAQLRYYFDEICVVKMINAAVNYANEYLGNSDRLVITPLTDRCYRTLIGAYHLHLNGAPEGPAGTGKTETTKDLAKAIAVQCVVFNCSDGLDYKAMGKFFKGLASSGAWACFDEFNRIDLEVLSVVAQQILSIVMAVRAHLETFVFEGTELILNPAVYICITMNPGYAGRSELPDNLKVLFRTVAMMVPDYAMIGEISLYSYGFKDARTLSVKIVTTYRLCSEQLSSQNHYDYGMRAVKTVLSACGNIKRKFPDEMEDILLLRSLIDVNLPKFLSHDVPLFEGIISDLFPGIVLPEPNYDNLLECCHEVCKQLYLQPREIFLLKIIQMYEMRIVRHGFMLVGDPFSGKTSTIKTLAASLGLMFDKGYGEAHTEYQFINPKSVTMGQLYGQFDPISYEWSDGVVATCFRNFCMDPSKNRKWVIFDGPVDAVWIENMNTVLDDNKKLCLTSGEVMSMTNEMSMVFEVMDLTQASPATVSRCGMIYMESSNLGWRPFMESWILLSNPVWCQENKELITVLFDWLINPCLSFVRKHCRQLAYAGEINLVKTTMLIIEMTLNKAISKFNGEYLIVAWIEATMMFAVVWGIGGILDAQSRAQFDEFYKEIWRGNDPHNPIPEYFEKFEVSLPPDGMIIDYCYIYKTPKGSWKAWQDITKLCKIDENCNILRLLVPTVDTVRYIHMIKLHIQFNTRFLMVGPTGTGKSFYLQDYLMFRLDQEKFEPSFITFTTQTSSNMTQDLIISKLLKGKRNQYFAPTGKTSIMFIDDMNMPVKEKYGAQPPIELLRQMFDHNHWYNLKDTGKILIHHVMFVAAMGIVGGSRQEIYPRFLRHFSIYSINEFSDESMIKIFSNVLFMALKRNGFATEVYMSVLQIVNATIEVYKAASRELRPTPAKSHYVFNLRDVSRIIQGMAMLKKETAEADKKVYPKLWVHENLRIFYDRLIEENDRNWFYNKLRDCVSSYFKENFDMLFETFRNEDGIVTEKALSDLLFGTFLDLDAIEDDKKYEQIASMNVFEDIASNVLDEYNSTHKNKMDIVLFRHALEHLSKVCRILSMPKGSALLVGIGGSGRQSLTRLGSAICGHILFQPEITKNYALNEFREDIKYILKESGGLGKHTVCYYYNNISRRF